MSKHARHGAPPPQRNFAPLRPGEAPVYQPLPNHSHAAEEAAEETTEPAAELEAESENTGETAATEVVVDLSTQSNIPAR